MQILFGILIVLLLLGFVPLKKRYGSVSLVTLIMVVFLLGLMLGWF